MHFTYLKVYVYLAIRHISAPLWNHSIPTCPAYIAPHKRRANSNAFQYGGRSGAFFSLIFHVFYILKVYVDLAIRHISAPLWHHSIPTCPAYIAPHMRRTNSNAFKYGGCSGAFFSPIFYVFYILKSICRPSH